MKNALPSSGYEVTVCGTPAEVHVDVTGIHWSYTCSANDNDGGCGSRSVSFSEILAAQRADHRPLRGPSPSSFSFWCGGLLGTYRNNCASLHDHAESGSHWPGVLVYSFKRDTRRKSEWHPFLIDIRSKNADAIEQLLLDISSGVASASATRPRRLLLLLNPNAGARQARTLYNTTIKPVLELGGIDIRLIETQYAGHAAELVRNCITNDTVLSFLRDYDGVAAVGGDGIFHETVNGFLKACATLKSQETVKNALRLRLAHIPCGSTDAVACSLNGTRSVFTAAMHIALGDRTSLDVLKVDFKGENDEEIFSHHACCIATYGFMGDVVKASEQYRWLGPLRYDIVGAGMLALNQSYRCRISYIPASGLEEGSSSQGNGNNALGCVCLTDCKVCRGVALSAASPAAVASNNYTQISDQNLENDIEAGLLQQNNWVHIEDNYMSVMLMNMPCRSEKTPFGMSRLGHLASGSFTLALVKECSPLQYLRFLSTMSSSGLCPGQLPEYVDVVEAVACRVQNIQNAKTSSHWNLDGELVSGVDMSARSQEGLIQVFARGPEG